MLLAELVACKDFVRNQLVSNFSNTTSLKMNGKSQEKKKKKGKQNEQQKHEDYVTKK